MPVQSVQALFTLIARIKIGLRHHVIDHALQAKTLAVLWRVDTADPVIVQRTDLFGNDHAAAAAEDAYISPAALAQHVDHVGEEFTVAALIGADSNALHIFFDSRINNFPDTTIVTEVNYLRTRGL